MVFRGHDETTKSLYEIVKHNLEQWGYALLIGDVLRDTNKFGGGITIRTYYTKLPNNQLIKFEEVILDPNNEVNDFFGLPESASLDEEVLKIMAGDKPIFMATRFQIPRKGNVGEIKYAHPLFKRKDKPNGEERYEFHGSYPLFRSVVDIALHTLHRKFWKKSQ